MKKTNKQMHKLTEKKVQRFMRDNWLFKNGWTIKYKEAQPGEKGPDIEVSNSNKHKFIVECKGSKNFESDFLSSLGQICTRMKRKPEGIKYGLALPVETAKIAIRRIPKKFAVRNKLNIFSVSNSGLVKRYLPSDMKG